MKMKELAIDKHNGVKAFTPLACRLFGHRWTLRMINRCDDMRCDQIMVFPACVRCGADIPAELLESVKVSENEERHP